MPSLLSCARSLARETAAEIAFAVRKGGDVIIVNTETIPGKEITAFHGLVQGNTIRAKHLGRDIGAALKNVVGGELKAYTELLSDARQEAVDRMIAQAEELGANAVVNVRFTTSSIAGGAAELYAYGTAVTAS